MEVQNRMLLTVAATLLLASSARPALEAPKPLLPPPVQNIDVVGDYPEPDDHHHYASAVNDDAVDVDDADSLHAIVGDKIADDAESLHEIIGDKIADAVVGHETDDEEDVDSSPFPHLSFASSSESPDSDKTVYDFEVKDLDGREVSLSVYKGKVLLIVNYANICYLTRHNVNKLSRMARTLGPDFKVLMFPSNSFYQNIGKESGPRLHKYHPEFDVFSEINVIGFSEHPLYTFLKRATPGEGRLTYIRWNFTKFLIDRNGHPVARYNPLVHFKTIKKGVMDLLQPVEPLVVID